MENYVVFLKDPNVLELIDSVDFIVIVITRQLQLYWSFMCMIINVLFRIICLVLPSDQLQKWTRNRARFRSLRLDCIHFFVTVINRRLRRFWSFLCRSFMGIPQMVNTVLSQIVCLFGGIYEFLFLQKSPSDQLRKSMNKQDRFPLLKLDYVAIREVLNTLDPIDYINFSKASKSCRRLSAIKKPYKVQLNFMEPPMLWFWNGSFGSYRGWKLKDTWIARFFWYLEDPFHAMKELYLDAKSLMDVEVDFVAIYMDDFVGECEEIVEWLRSNCQEFSGFYIYGQNQRHEDVQYILDNLKFKDSLHILAHTIEELPLRIPETIDQLTIRNGSWITLDYIMSLKMNRFQFAGTNLTNQDINQIYKSWIEMKSHQNLEWFEINLTNLEDLALFDYSGTMKNGRDHARMDGTMPEWTGPYPNERDHARMNGTMPEWTGPCPNERDQCPNERDQCPNERDQCLNERDHGRIYHDLYQQVLPIQQVPPYQQVFQQAGPPPPYQSLAFPQQPQQLGFPLMHPQQMQGFPQMHLPQNPGPSQIQLPQNPNFPHMQQQRRQQNPQRSQLQNSGSSQFQMPSNSQQFSNEEEESDTEIDNTNNVMTDEEDEEEYEEDEQVDQEEEEEEEQTTSLTSPARKRARKTGQAPGSTRRGAVQPASGTSLGSGSGRGAVRGAVRGADQGAGRGATRQAGRGATRQAGRGAVRGAARGATQGVVRKSGRGATRGAAQGAARGTRRGAVRGAAHGVAQGTSRRAVQGVVRGAAQGAVPGTGREATRGAARGAPRGTRRGAVQGSGRGKARGAVRGAVRGASRGAAQ